MKTFLHDPAIRIWGLSGLTGMVLMAGVLLEEGQARTYSPSPENSSIQTSRLNVHTHSFGSIITQESSGKNVVTEQKTLALATEKEVSNKNLAKKKRMGLAILFLGILAKEG